MKYTNRFAALMLAATMGAGFVTMPFAAHASEEGKRNTAIGLGAAAAALLLTQKNKIPGAIAAAGAVVAYSQYDKDVQDRHRRERDYGYDDRYYNNRRNNDSYRYNDGYGYNNSDRNYRDRDRYRDGDSRYRIGDARYHEQRNRVRDEDDCERDGRNTRNRTARRAR